MKIKNEENNDEEKFVLAGFLTKPVFRVEDTDGEPLEYEKLELPELPLMERANEWGLTVKAIPFNRPAYGSYIPSSNEIKLATPEEKTWLHELSHHCQKLLHGELKKGQDPLQEISAELSAQALCHLVGKSMDSQLGNTYEYIEYYAKQVNLTPISACLKVLGEVESIINLILGRNENKKAA